MDPAKLQQSTIAYVNNRSQKGSIYDESETRARSRLLGQECNQMAALNKELAATVLIDAVFTTDEQACQNYGVALRSL
jgi:hypothetical protein